MYEIERRATEVSLEEFCKQNSQSAAAEIMGVGQSAVSQALAAGRNIRITTDPAGRHGWYEIKRVTRRGPRRSTSSGAPT